MLHKIVRFFLLILPISLFFFQNVLEAQSYSTVEGGVIDKKILKKKKLAHYIIGYNNFKFYSSEEEVRKQIVADGFADADQIKERIGEIYTYPDYDSDFTFFDSQTYKFLDFSLASIPMEDFLKNIRVNPNGRKFGAVGHLMAGNALDFKVLTWDNTQKGTDWDFELFFYRQMANGKAVYRLVAVTLTLNAGEKVHDIRMANPAYIRRSLGEIVDKYGSVNYHVVKNVGSSLLRHYYTYQRTLTNGPLIVGKVQDEKQFDFDPKSQIITQLTVSYLQKNQDYGNFKVTYLSTGFLQEILPKLNTSLTEYDDFGQGSSIDF